MTEKTTEDRETASPASEDVELDRPMLRRFIVQYDEGARGFFVDADEAQEVARQVKAALASPIPRDTLVEALIDARVFVRNHRKARTYDEGRCISLSTMGTLAKIDAALTEQPTKPRGTDREALMEDAHEWVCTQLARLIGYKGPDNACNDLVEQGYGNALTNLRAFLEVRASSASQKEG